MAGGSSYAPGLNSCSLEHSFTNLFALTELNGIHYRKYVMKNPQSSTSIINDPIIEAYAHFQKEGLLAAWIKAKKDTTDPSKPYLFANYAKELYVFWFDHRDFTHEDKHIFHDLIMEQSGSWIQSGLSYEVRTILFKALHNLIEKFLLKKSFVRIGKWFLNTARFSTEEDDSQLGASFSFFLHGESTVCISLDLKRLPLISPITKRHLQYCITFRKRIPVVLCPYGLCAELIGPTTDISSEEALNDELQAWLNFYPVNGCDEFGQPFDISMFSTPNKQMRGSIGSNSFYNPLDKPTCKFVDLLVCGYRMRYPTSFVLICNEDLSSNFFKVIGSETLSPNGKKVNPFDSVPIYTDLRPSSLVVEMQSEPLVNDLVLQQNVNFYGPSLNGAKVPNSDLIKKYPPRKNKVLLDERLRLSPTKNSRHHRRFFLCHGSNLISIYSKRNVHFPHEFRRNFLADRHLKRTLRSISHLNHKTIAKLKDSTIPASCEAFKPLYISSSRIVAPSKSIDCFCSKLAMLRAKSEMLTMEEGLPPNGSSNAKRPKAGPYHKRSVRANCFYLERGDFKIPLQEIDNACDEEAAAKVVNNSALNWHVSQSSISNSSITSSGTGLGACFGSLISVEDPLMPTLSPQQPAPGHQKDTIPSQPNITHIQSISLSNAIPKSLTPPIGSGNFPELSIKEEPSVPESFPIDETKNQEFSKSTDNLKREPLTIDDDVKRFVPTHVLKTNSINNKYESMANHIQSEQITSFEATNSLWLLNQIKLAFQQRNDTQDDQNLDAWDRQKQNLVPGLECLKPSALDQFELEELGIESSSCLAYSFDKGVARRFLAFSQNNGELRDEPVMSPNPEFGTLRSGLYNHLRSAGPFGMSLTSSTGSGHIGPAELTLMLPTPPSQEAVMLSEASPSMLCPNASIAEDGTSTVSISPAQIMKNNLESIAKQSPIENSDRNAIINDWSFIQPKTAFDGISVQFRSSGQELKAILSLPRKNMDAYNSYIKNFNSKQDIKQLSIESCATVKDDKSLIKCASPNFSPQPMETTVSYRRMKQTAQPNYNISCPQAIDVISCVHPTTIFTNQDSNTSSNRSSISSDMSDLMELQTRSKYKTKAFRALLEVMNTCSKANAYLLLALNQILTTTKTNSLDNEYLEKLDCVNGLELNLILQDSSINIFKDHNFDSCNICVCTTSVWSREVGIYLPSPLQELTTNNTTNLPSSQPTDSLLSGLGVDPNAPNGTGPQFDSLMNGLTTVIDQCHCGFSAVINQRYACNSNLFYEDEVEVTRINLISVLCEEPDLQALISSSPVNESIVMPANLSAFYHKNPNGNNSDKPSAQPILLSPYTLVPLPAANKWYYSTSEDNNDDHINLSMLARRNLPLIFKWCRGPSVELSARLFTTWIDYEATAFANRTRESLMEFKEICALMLASIPQCVYQSLSNLQHFPEMHGENMYSPTYGHNVSPRRKPYSIPRRTLSGLQSDKKAHLNAPRFDEANRSNGVFVHPAFVFKSAAKTPVNIGDHVLFLETIKPLLQEAISSTRSFENSFTVDGPLTWKNFHQLACRGNEETCRPQPVPQFRFASADHQSCLLAPFAISHWDHLALSPLSFKKRLAYAVVCPGDQIYSNKITQSFRRDLPDELSNFSTSTGEPRLPSLNDHFIQTRMSEFFSELSAAYNTCQFGVHLPYYKPHHGTPDTAFIPINIDTSTKSSLTSLSHKERKFMQHVLLSLKEQTGITSGLASSGINFPDNSGNSSNTLPSPLDNNSVAYELQEQSKISKLQDILLFMMLYLQNMREILIKTILERGISQADGKSHLSQIFPLNKNQSESLQPSFKSSKISPDNGKGPLSSTFDVSDFGKENDTYLVIYIIEPFTYLCDMTPGLSRILAHTLIQWGSNSVLSSLPVVWRPRVNIQVISLLDFFPQSSEWVQRVNAIALNLYQQVDRHVKPSLVNANRTLTGFGPSADRETISAEQEVCHIRKIYAPAYVLHKHRDFYDQWKGGPNENLDKSSVLFVAYCLSEDQQWLLAACSDETGLLLEETVVSLRVSDAFLPTYARAFKSRGGQSETSNPNNSFSLRRYALAKLWDFIIHVVAGTCHPCRIVISRVGRLGHGEMKAWNGLLCRTNLLEVNHSLEQNCLLCSLVTKSSGFTSLPSTVGYTSGPMAFDVSKNHSCNHQLPTIISACLVSIEPQSTFRVYADRNGLAVHSNMHRGDRQNVFASQAGGIPGKLNSGSSLSSGQNNNQSGNSSNQQSGSSTYSLPVPLNLQGLPLGLKSAPALVGPWQLPSTTHILVFPTSTSASAQMDQELDQDDYLQLDFDEDDQMEMDMFVGELDSFNPVGASSDRGGSSNRAMNGQSQPGVSNHGERNAGLSSSYSACGSGPDTNIFSFAKQHQDQLGALSCSTSVSNDQKRRLKSDNEQVTNLLNMLETLQMKTQSEPQTNSAAIMLQQQEEAIVRKILQTMATHIFGGTGNTLPLGVPDAQLTEPPNGLMIQPIAMGYYLSTAPADSLPWWFWSSCPHAQWQNPVCLKSALHLKCSLVAADETSGAALGHVTSERQGSAVQGHPLDSSTTCDVLRFIMESFNALSWLTMNPVSNDRTSCLPLHIFHLSKMCHLTQHYG